jgi:hypothetical protein
MVTRIKYVLVATLVAAFVLVVPAASPFVERTRARAAQFIDRNTSRTIADLSREEGLGRDNSGTKGGQQNQRAPQLAPGAGVAGHGSFFTEREGYSTSQTCRHRVGSFLMILRILTRESTDYRCC